MKSKKAKSKKKPKSEAKSDKEQLSEVDKTFYELQIADLTRKLSRITNLSIELEQRNDTLHTNNRHLDEDRADVIAFLKKTVQDQSDEITDLLGRLEALKATLQAENHSFLEQLAKKDDSYQEMQTQLNSEIKLLEGKLNALEEFRLQREELNKKFEEQGQRHGEQEQTHKDAMYAVERKFIVDKQVLVKQMEQKLLDLANEFQSVTDMRITESTQRMIRENIAVSNENVKLVLEQKELYNDREELMDKFKVLRLQKELACDQSKLALKKCNVLKGIVNELTSRYESLEAEYAGLRELQGTIQEKHGEIETLKGDIATGHRNEKLLQSNFKDSMTQRKLLLAELTKANAKSRFLTKTLFEAVFKIRERLKLGMSDAEIDAQCAIEANLLEDLDHSQAIMNDLYNMFLRAKEAERECKHLDNWVQFYQTGCAGFTPKPRDLAEVSEKNQATQIGVSFEEFLKMDAEGKMAKSTSDTTIPSDFSSS